MSSRTVKVILCIVSAIAPLFPSFGIHAQTITIYAGQPGGDSYTAAVQICSTTRTPIDHCILRPVHDPYQRLLRVLRDKSAFRVSLVQNPIR